MTGENIICFAKDWSEDPTSNNHVMRQLARGNRVLWLNSIATRTPSLTSGRDLKKLALKVRGFLQGAKQVGDQMWVYTPIVLPLPHSPLGDGVEPRDPPDHTEAAAAEAGDGRVPALDLPSQRGGVRGHPGRIAGGLLLRG